MIDLQIEEYCKECNAFEVEQETNMLAAWDVDISQHKLRCVHRDKCKAIKKYLERKNENGTP